jgi:hypothetical protein
VEHQGSRAGPATLAHGLGEETARGEPVRPSQHQDPEPGGRRVTARAGSDREAVATLAATRCQDGATGTGAHAQAETVGLVTATVVRLERTLAHGIALRCRGWNESRARTGLGALSTTRRSSAGHRSRPAPPIHGTRGEPGREAQARRPCLVVDMRHRSTTGSTEQRYAVPVDRVKPSTGQTATNRSHHHKSALRMPVDNRLIHRSRAC